MFNKLFKAEGGFTLVELLVTIAILGVLFGIVTLTLSGVGDNAEATVKIAECGVVQSAADIWLASDTTHAITPRVVGSVAVITAADADAEFKGYLRDLPTSYTYYWTAAGDVTCADVP
jgi:prepilin-type N-terminal cleavage/methylation domain-containing protein